MTNILNFQKLFQADKSQVATSNLKKLRQSQNWEKLSEIEAENIQGGNSLDGTEIDTWQNPQEPEWPGPGLPPPGWPWSGGW